MVPSSGPARGEQLNLDGLALPAEFVTRWRELELANALPAATLAAEQVVTFGDKHWIAIRINGAKQLAAGHDSFEACADDLFTRRLIECWGRQ